jgi:hypothetical protein
MSITAALTTCNHDRETNILSAGHVGGASHLEPYYEVLAVTDALPQKRLDAQWLLRENVEMP